MRTRPAQPLLLAAAALMFSVACSEDPSVDSADAGALADAGSDAEDSAGADAADARPTADVPADVTTDAAGDSTPDAIADGAVNDVDNDTTLRPDLAWCQGSTSHRWDPFVADELEFFPDGVLVRLDEQSPTGERLDYSPETAPWLQGTPALLGEGLQALNDLSGFGTIGGAVIRFTGPVGDDLPGDARASITSDAWMWFDLDAEPPTRIPYEVELLDDDETVVLWPLRPLRRGTRHALVVTREARAADGDCFAPSEMTRSLLRGDVTTSDHVARAGVRYAAALDQLGIDPADVAAMSVYLTHDDLGPMLEVAARIPTQPVEWGSWSGCTPRGEFRECETSTTVLDSRGETGLVDPSVTPVEAAIPMTIWLPEGDGPWPVLLYAHGLNSEREEGREIADRITPHGFAVVSMEAVEHGDHPSVGEDELGEPALRFLGIDLGRVVIDARAIRGNFNQTNLDRLRLVHLLRTRPDLDGDGEPDIDPERVGYIGASLGALCGVGFLALSPDIDAAILTIGGARLLSIVKDSDLFADYLPLIDLVLGSRELFFRLMPVAQHVVDPADPGAWAPHVIRDRFDGRVPPSVLAAVGIYDDVVPSSSGRALARSMNLPHLPPVAESVALLDVLEQAPVSGNFADGTRTSVFFQYDRVTRGDGGPELATHTRSAKSNESAEQIRVFFGAWADGEVPIAIDPYETLGTPTLP